MRLRNRGYSSRFCYKVYSTGVGQSDEGISEYARGTRVEGYSDRAYDSTCPSVSERLKARVNPPYTGSYLKDL
jgi:hypothetical protein